MRISAMAGLCLMIFGVIHVLQEIATISMGRGRPGSSYDLVTAALFTAGAALLWGNKIKRSLVKSRK